MESRVSLFAFLFFLAASPVRPQTPGTFANGDGSVHVEYNLGTGAADIYFHGSKRISGAFADVKLASGRVRSLDFVQRKAQSSEIQDGNGRGRRFEITCTGAGTTVMKQAFYLYDGRDYLLTETTLEGSALASNWMSPLSTETAGGVDLGGGTDLRALEAPWDNDRGERYNAGPLNRTATSYEVAAFYDNASRHGLIAGSVSHDLSISPSRPCFPTPRRIAAGSPATPSAT